MTFISQAVSYNIIDDLHKHMDQLRIQNIDNVEITFSLKNNDYAIATESSILKIYNFGAPIIVYPHRIADEDEWNQSMCDKLSDIQEFLVKEANERITKILKS